MHAAGGLAVTGMLACLFGIRRFQKSSTEIGIGPSGMTGYGCGRRMERSISISGVVPFPASVFVKNAHRKRQLDKILGRIRTEASKGTASIWCYSGRQYDFSHISLNRDLPRCSIFINLATLPNQCWRLFISGPMVHIERGSHNASRRRPIILNYEIKANLNRRPREWRSPIIAEGYRHVGWIFDTNPWTAVYIECFLSESIGRLHLLKLTRIDPGAEYAQYNNRNSDENLSDIYQLGIPELLHKPSFKNFELLVYFIFGIVSVIGMFFVFVSLCCSASRLGD